jgi:hypothetical protein
VETRVLLVQPVQPVEVVVSEETQPLAHLLNLLPMEVEEDAVEQYPL